MDCYFQLTQFRCLVTLLVFFILDHYCKFMTNKSRDVVSETDEDGADSIVSYEYHLTDDMDIKMDYESEYNSTYHWLTRRKHQVKNFGGKEKVRYPYNASICEFEETVLVTGDTEPRRDYGRLLDAEALPRCPSCGHYYTVSRSSSQHCDFPSLHSSITKETVISIQDIYDRTICLPCRQIFGGITTLTPKDYSTVNGYSIFHWNWGAEDDDFHDRTLIPHALQDAVTNVRSCNHKIQT